MGIQALTVTQLISSVKLTLEGQFQEVLVEGEVSNFSKSSSGHFYFNLLDRDSAVRVAMFRFDTFKNPMINKLKDGDKILCFGPLTVYQKKGEFQIQAKQVTLAGRGSLQEQFELLKKKLALLGYFDLDRKKKIPLMPKKIGLITSHTAAAYQDFINIFKRRAFSPEIILIPSLVQGDQAPKSLVNALKKAQLYNQQNKQSPLDVLILTRGGGSIEDLWAFNSEELAHALFACEIPTISAVGHEVDHTICDFVADMRAETPSAAAEKITEFQVSAHEKYLRFGKLLMRLMDQKFIGLSHQLSQYHPHRNLHKLLDQFSKFKQRLNRFDLKHRLLELAGLHSLMMRVDDAEIVLNNFYEKRVLKQIEKVDSLGKLLKALDPTSILSRGYSILKTGNGVVVGNISDFKKLENNSNILVQFQDGIGSVQKIKD